MFKIKLDWADDELPKDFTRADVEARVSGFLREYSPSVEFDVLDETSQGWPVVEFRSDEQVVLQAMVWIYAAGESGDGQYLWSWIERV